MSARSEPPLLALDDLRVHFAAGGKRTVRAVDGVTFEVHQGETFGLVGESGCGKSTTARAILNLIPVTSGRVSLQGERIDGLSDHSMLPYRRRMQMIFQDPFASLNPRMTVGRIVGEPLKIFELVRPGVRKLEVMRLLELVGLDPRHLNRYPHEFSGGQRQRIGIARALAARPELIICDEPVSALDVSIQAQVVNLLQDLQQQLGVSYLFIAHDLAVVRHISHRVGVMYLGRLVETAPAAQLYAAPRHPYTQALLAAVPIPDPPIERARRREPIRGEVPSPDQVIAGCAFADRCPLVEEGCRTARPELVGETHQVACFVAERELQPSPSTPSP